MTPPRPASALRSFFGTLRALRVRLVLFFAGVLTAALLVFGSAVYLAAVAAEAVEDEPIQEKERELAAVRRLLALALLAGIPIAVTTAVGGAYLLSRHALFSIGQIVRTANTLTFEHLDERIPNDPGAGREVEELVDSLNAMLDRIARSATSLRRFTADAAHELRTPLAVLSSDIEICLHRPREPQQLLDTLGETLEGLSRLSRLVDLLLTLAHSDADELPVAPTTVYPASLLAQISAPFAEVAAERGVCLDLALPDSADDACALHTDPLLLGRAFANLLDNACKFCPAGSTVTVQLRQAQGAVDIVVRDSGPGMSQDELARVCDRFYRGSSHRSTTEGFGLGLSLTHEFMRLLGGQLVLRPAAPRGIEAVLTLPSAVPRG